jgi:cytochrome c oxidase subunit 3
MAETATLNGTRTIGTARPAESVWAGGVSPFALSWNKLMMWIFIIGDALLFAGFLASYGFVRLASPTWPDRADIFHLPFIGAMTFILISSGATMAAGVEAARRGQWKTVVRFIAVTILGGAVFLGMQAYEWSAFIHEGARLNTNPWGVPLFSSCFFLITGFHGFHVFTGLLILTITAIRAATGRSKPEGIEIAGLYWAFVDLVWVFIFPLFYLI